MGPWRELTLLPVLCKWGPPHQAKIAQDPKNPGWSPCVSSGLLNPPLCWFVGFVESRCSPPARKSPLGPPILCAGTVTSVPRGAVDSIVLGLQRQLPRTGRVVTMIRQMISPTSWPPPPELRWRNLDPSLLLWEGGFLHGRWRLLSTCCENRHALLYCTPPFSCFPDVALLTNSRFKTSLEA